MSIYNKPSLELIKTPICLNELYREFYRQGFVFAAYNNDPIRSVNHRPELKIVSVNQRGDDDTRSEYKFGMLSIRQSRPYSMQHSLENRLRVIEQDNANS